ncbi:hypothetical protein L195_g046881, partial [Trifolium pratense]
MCGCMKQVMPFAATLSAPVAAAVTFSFSSCRSGMNGAG